MLNSVNGPKATKLYMYLKMGRMVNLMIGVCACIGTIKNSYAKAVTVF